MKNIKILIAVLSIGVAVLNFQEASARCCWFGTCCWCKARKPTDKYLKPFRADRLRAFEQAKKDRPKFVARVNAGIKADSERFALEAEVIRRADDLTIVEYSRWEKSYRERLKDFNKRAAEALGIAESHGRGS